VTRRRTLFSARHVD